MSGNPSGSRPVATSGLSSQRILSALVDLARELGVEVRTENGDFPTSLCRIKGQPVVYINTKESLNRAAEVVADSLAGHDLEAHFILPEVRTLLEGTVAGQPSDATRT